jgi:hypothetical protein
MDDSKISQYLQYLARGWALVPLHDVACRPGPDARCSCGSDCGKSRGKHPRAKHWQRPEHLVVSPDQLFAWATSATGFTTNMGLATGPISGVWALDLDPAAVTDWNAANALIATLPPTWSQRTGSGGRHWAFLLPDDFVPNNSAKRLPDGFDVRGARRGEVSGGQIVLAPSVSWAGAYEVIGDPAAPALRAPAALEELVRPAPPREHSPMTRVTAPAAGQEASYAVAAVNGELSSLRGASSRRNDRAWQAAARVLELANTGLVDRETVYGAWWSAAAAHPDPAVTVPERELLSVWASAERHVGDRPADLSGVGGPSGWGGDGVRPVGAPGAAPPSGPAGSGSGAAPGLGHGGGPGGYPQPTGSLWTTGVVGVVGGVVGDNGGVAAQVGGGVGDPDLDNAVTAMLAQLLDVEALRALSPPQPLINGVLDLDSTAWLIGESGSYKSFVALDFAAHVGLGRVWRGHDVHQGEVVYVVAEGARGMRLRVDAWEREHGPMKGVRFLPMPVQANGPGWRVLVEMCRRLGPALVIVDTQARVTIGLDENSNSDMSVYAERVDEIKRATRACVLTVHHLGRNGTNARGASAIDGAQDAELRVKKLGAYMVELHMDKQKDQAEERPLAMRLRRSEGGTDPVTGRDLSSLVVDHDAVPQLGDAETVGMPAGKRRALALYQIVATVFSQGDGGTRADIRALFMGLPEIEALEKLTSRRSAWHEAWNLLVSRGRVMRYGRTDRYSVFAPPDGSADGMLTMNTGGPDDMPPDGWEIHWPESDRQPMSES